LGNGGGTPCLGWLFIMLVVVLAAAADDEEDGPLVTVVAAELLFLDRCTPGRIDILESMRAPVD
jgi:hypothetical protein